ncbi:PREDICTED: uncharacterized protein LOC109325558 isoform X1 [Lupinus angustifolius]|uniref:uncharacterized protein LOC109325558 isoform X1 n=1 Tax=Lupinus angustifolius TaxID=3871 RepID=UPI00092FCB6F|nr:PREDICTED: uncharacterized protein LOC109325558 isoform X1 [Lupinus angustifolius]
MSNPNPQIPYETQNPNPKSPNQEEQEEQAPPTPHVDSQFPKTLTLPDQDPQIDDLPDPDAGNPNPNQRPEDGDIIMQDLTQDQNAEEKGPEALANFATVTSTVSRRGPKRKKLVSRRRNAQEKQLREKLKVVVETLKPIPFVPSKALDFESHKTLLQRLGLWDFVHIEIGSVIHEDLVAQLIASYGPSTRCSYVNGCRINVNRADLARALKLPVKLPVKKATVSAAAVESVVLAESIVFIEQLVFTWMLLHDDMYVMTDDVLAYLKVIKEGHFEKVDWAGLIWNMLEKELKEEKLANCYYASHLQQLIKTQHRELLEEAPKMEEEGEAEVKGEGEEAEVKGEGEEVGVKDEEEEEEEEEDDVGEELDGSGDVNMGAVDESRVHELEENKIELSLGQDNVERLEVGKEQVGGDQIMDFEPAQEEHEMWFLHQKNSAREPYLRPCHTSDVNIMHSGEMKEDRGEEGQDQEEGEEQEDEEDAEEDQHEGRFHFSPRYIPAEGMPSGTGSLIQGMEAGQLNFGSGVDLHDNHVGNFLSSRDDGQMIAGSSLFGNGHKRDIGGDYHSPRYSLNGSNKRLRSDSPWNAEPVDMDMCLETMQNSVEKARMLYAAKEQAYIEAANNQQVLVNEIQRRDNMLENLHKVKMDDSHKIYRLEKELYMMTNLVEGYRKALKETQKAFAEYRARCPQADEPLYKDVPGSGGLVLSVKEFEKERLRKEEEERVKMRDYEKKFRDIEGAWISKLEGHLSRVQSMGNRLVAIGDQVKHLNEVVASKVADSPGLAPTSEGQTA